jgi:tetratricopeptide (TPR) repeat protein
MVHNGFARQNRFRLSTLGLAVLIGGVTGRGPWVTSALAQPVRMVPSAGYHAAFSAFYEGEYRDALDVFRDEGRGAIKTPQSRWIDSICYETMVGECYYHMGHLNQALDHYTAALQLCVAFSDWMIRVQFPPTIRPSAARVRIPWGVSSRQSRLGYYPPEMPITQGRIDQREVIQRGGVVTPATSRLIRVDEIIRCTTLAIRRRANLLGPLASRDPLFDELITRLSRRPGPPNHWSEAWIDVQLGLALSAGGKTVQAVPHLKRAIVAAGEFDHPLTSTALLELGRLAMIDGDYATASKYFEEATYAAVHYPDPGVLEEAFSGGALSHLLANRKGVYPPLAAAIDWARVKDLRELRASLALSAAENYAVLGETRQAARFLDEARSAIGRRDMINGRIGARLNFLSALVLFQQKKVPEGDAAFLAAMGYMQQGSYWLLHIGLADRLYTAGGASPRTAMELYTDVLRDPQPTDWAFDPMEAMAVLATPHPLPIDHWFEVAMQRKEHETALEISDRARRHRFFSSLAFGGRLQSLRWILEGPPEALDQPSLLVRGDLLARYPLYDQLSQQVRALRGALRAMPLVPDDPGLFRQQSRDLAQLAALSMQQEAILREMAVRREPAELVFPPLRTTRDIQRSLPSGHALLVFFVARGQLYGFLLNNQKYAYWQIEPLAVLSRQIVSLLRELGHFQPNHELALKELTDKQWQKSARQILELLLKGSQADFSQKFDELVIVPDGVLWYLPFEALEVEVDGELRPLISRFRIRYVPTASLATCRGPARKPTGNTAVVTGRLFPRDDDALARDAFARLAQALPGAVALKSPTPAPSAVYATLFDRLIVLDDLNLSNGGPYGWAPVPIDQGKLGNSLSDWLGLPWGGPDEVILPGYHTAAESSLKGVNPPLAGNEIFLSVCGLMSSGSRTLLLSRWRTGGQTAFDLVREFAQELPHSSPADAWQRSVFLAAGSRLNPDAEPRVKKTVTDELPKANHPFFWAGYMLVDPGTVAEKPEPEPAEPVLKLKKPDQPAPPPEQPERKVEGGRQDADANPLSPIPNP